MYIRVCNWSNFPERRHIAQALTYFHISVKDPAHRYELAKTRWCEETGRPGMWWLKQQQETLQQVCDRACVFVLITTYASK